MTSTGFNVPYSYMYRKYINHIHLLKCFRNWKWDHTFNMLGFNVICILYYESLSFVHNAESQDNDILGNKRETKKVLKNLVSFFLWYKSQPELSLVMTCISILFYNFMYYVQHAQDVSHI
jgi:hypothetical protein